MSKERVVVITGDNGAEEELALLVETIPVPTVQVIDTTGAEYVIPAHHARPADPDETRRYWTRRRQHSAECLCRLMHHQCKPSN